MKKNHISLVAFFLIAHSGNAQTNELFSAGSQAKALNVASNFCSGMPIGQAHSILERAGFSMQGPMVGGSFGLNSFYRLLDGTTLVLESKRIRKKTASTLAYALQCVYIQSNGVNIVTVKLQNVSAPVTRNDEKGPTTTPPTVP